MTDLGSGSESEDRVVGLEPIEGFSFESDGAPITELDLDAADSLVDRGDTLAEQALGERSWRFGHVIVDEAQDLTPMQWRMIARRSLGGAVTMVGDLAQRSIGEPGTWSHHLPPSLADHAYQELTVNYRSPSEINALASAVLCELAPELSGSTSIRSSGSTPQIVRVDDLATELAAEVESARQGHGSGRLAVIGMDLDLDRDAADNLGRTKWLDPWQAKGLEFDTVVLVEPAAFLDHPYGLSLLYVALTRTTDRLFIVHERPLPEVLLSALTE